MPDDTTVISPHASAPPLPPYPPYAPFPPFPPYPPYPPVVVQCCHGSCGCGQHGGQAPPPYAMPPGYAAPPSGTTGPTVPASTGTPTGTPAGPATGGTGGGTGGFNPFDPLGSVLNMFGSLFGGHR